MKKPFTMSRFLLSIVTMMVCAAGYAANYFVPGTVWEYQEFENGQLRSTTVELVDAVDADGAPCYQEVRKSIVTDSSGNPVSDEVETINGWLVKVDGEKVYLCSKWASEPQWQLVYDFSLQPGEGCLIKETQLFSGETQKEVYFKYIGMTKIKHYDVEVMEMKVFWSEEESGDDSKAINTQYWIPGVGSNNRLDGCYRFAYPDEEPMQYLYLSTLMKVTDAEGDVVVEYNEISEPDEPEVKNDFVDGTVWDMISYSDMPDAETGHFQYKLDGVREIGDYEATQMYMLWPGNEPKFIAFVRTDGNKVYWAADEENPEWYLCYDFGMKAGDECDFYDMGSSDPSNNPITMRCIGEIRLSKYGSHPALMMQRIDNRQEPYKTEFWLKGIGSDYGPRYSSVSGLEGLGGKVQRVTNGDSVIFEKPGSGIAAPTVEQPSGAVSYYNLQGMRVSNPSGGVFIRVEGGKTSKVLLK